MNCVLWDICTSAGDDAESASLIINIYRVVEHFGIS